MVTAVLDPDRKFTVWNMREIYTGPTGTGQYVPNVDDMVIDWSRGVFRVMSVDQGKTNLSYLEAINLSNLNGGTDAANSTVVAGVGTNDNSFTIFVNNAVIPHTLTIDSRSRWFGSENSYVKVFRGTDASAENGVAISAMINSQGRVVSENIPLELVIIPNSTNYASKTAKPGYVTETLRTGERCLVVTYAADGRVTSKDVFVVQESDYIRTLDQSQKYVADIELLSPFLSKTNKRLLECPINMLTQSLALTARVTYEGGETRIEPVDGTKFTIAGLRTFVASQIGQTTDLVLTYNLSKTELSKESTAGDRRVARAYKLRTANIDTFYSIKLFVIPTWSNNRYVLRYYLYNLERQLILDVTDRVEYATDSPQFVGNRYGVTQNLRVAFNMANLGSQYAYFRHPQNITITLNNPASSTGVKTYFNIGYSEFSNYGDNVRAYFAPDDTDGTKAKLNVSCGYTDYLSWLTNVYRNLDPLYFKLNESEAPNPTHARIIIGTTFKREIPITDIVNDIRNISQGIAQGSTVRIELYSVDGDNVNELAMAPMIASSMI